MLVPRTRARVSTVKEGVILRSEERILAVSKEGGTPARDS